jgi:hypothetical protein
MCGTNVLRSMCARFVARSSVQSRDRDLLRSRRSLLLRDSSTSRPRGSLSRDRGWYSRRGSGRGSGLGSGRDSSVRGASRDLSVLRGSPVAKDTSERIPVRRDVIFDKIIFK